MPDFSDARAAFVTLPEDEYVGGLNGWERLAALVTVEAGIVALVPDKPPEMVGALYVDDMAAMNRKPDVGTVIASVEPDIAPGDRMLYAPWAGLWLRPFRVGGLKVSDMRFYGCPDGAMDATMVMREDLQDVLPAKVEGRTVTPIRDMVVIRRDKAASKSFGLVLPDDNKLRPLKATVVSAGPAAKVSPGDRVIYNPSAVCIGLKSLGNVEGWEGDLEDYAFVRSMNLLAVLDEQ